MQHNLFAKNSTGDIRSNKWRYPGFLLSLSLVFTLALTACGANSGSNKTTEASNTAQATQAPSTNNSSGEAGTEKAQTQVMKHEYGESTIPAHPQRVLSIGMEDILLSLDVPLVQAFSTDGYYLDKQIREKGIPVNDSFDVNLEAIASADPDLIIMNKFMTDEQGYEQLSKIAPTIAYERDNWQTDIIEIGKAVGKEDQAKALLKSYQEKVQAAKTKVVQAIGENKTVAFIRPSIKDVELDFPEWAWTYVIYNELGLKPDPQVLEIAKTATDTWGGTMMSLEKLPELTADYLFVNYGGSMDNETDYKKQTAEAAEVEKMSVWKAIPAVKKGMVHQVSSRHWALNGPIADNLKVDDVVNALTGSK